MAGCGAGRYCISGRVKGYFGIRVDGECSTHTLGIPGFVEQCKTFV